MKNIRLLVIVFSLISLVGCAGKTKREADLKAQELKTQDSSAQVVSEGSALVVSKEGDLVAREKTNLVEYIRQLNSQVVSKQDELYGSKRFGTRGKYGSLEACVAKLNKKNKDNKVVLTPRHSVVLPKAWGDVNKDKVGFDEGGSLVAMDEVKLRDRLKDLEAQNNKLNEVEEELLKELATCEAQL